MKCFSLFKLLMLIIIAPMLTMIGCVSTPPPLMPSSAQVIGIALIPQTKDAEKVLGQKEPVIIQNGRHQEMLFFALEINKDGAPVTSFDDYVTHDFVVKWKIRGQKKMDRSQLFLRLNKPRIFIYESDLGDFSKKYVITVNTDDAKIIWNAVGIMPPGL